MVTVFIGNFRTAFRSGPTTLHFAPFFTVAPVFQFVGLFRPHLPELAFWNPGTLRASLMQSSPLQRMPVAVFFILGIWVLISRIPLRLARF